jgi:hypothetical protein
MVANMVAHNKFPITKIKELGVKWFSNYTYNMNLEKVFSRGKNFTLESSSIGVRMKKWWTHKIVGFITWQNWELSRFPCRNPMIFCNFDVGFTTTHRIYYRRGGGASFPSLGYDVFYEFNSLMLHFMHHFSFNLH